MSISIRLDTREFEALLNSAAEQIPRAMRCVVSKVARDARRTALDAGARDMDVSSARAKKGIATVRAARASDLTATWTINTVDVSIADTNDAALANAAARKGPLAAAIEKLSGGGSSHLQVRRAFGIFGANSGKSIIMRRFGPGKGDIKRVEGEMFVTSMKQEGGAARIAWQKQAEAQMRIRTSEAVAAALSGSRALPSEGAD